MPKAKAGAAKPRPERQNSLERAELFVYKPNSRDMIEAEGTDEQTTIDPSNYKTMDMYEPSQLGRVTVPANAPRGARGAAPNGAASKQVAAPIPSKEKKGLGFPWRRGPSPAREPPAGRAQKPAAAKPAPASAPAAAATPAAAAGSNATPPPPTTTTDISDMAPRSRASALAALRLANAQERALNREHAHANSTGGNGSPGGRRRARRSSGRRRRS